MDMNLRKYLIKRKIYLINILMRMVGKRSFDEKMKVLTCLNPVNGRVITLKTNEFHPEVTETEGENQYYHGYWINNQWF